MIKEIFLPEKIGTYYVFRKRILGIALDKHSITASRVRAQGHHIAIEQHFEEIIEPNPSLSHDERIIQTLKTISDKAGTYDTVHSAIPSSLVIFKELQVPFASYEKIKLIINFEVEPLLPFSLQDAVIDFIITKSSDEKMAHVLVAAVQKQHIAQHLSLFEQAGIDPNIITVDLFALYGLYKHIPQYNQLSGGIVLLDINTHASRLAFIVDGQLRGIRNISHGLTHVAKKTAEQLGMSLSEVMEQMVRFGLTSEGNPELKRSIDEQMHNFLQTIRFTLTSFTSQIMGNNGSVEHILLLGAGAQIKDLPDYIHSQLHIPCQTFNASLIAEDKNITLKNSKSIPAANTISLATAMPFSITEHFNLRKDEFSIADQNTFLKQVIVASVFLVLMLGSLLTHYIWQTRTLQSELEASQQEAIAELKQRFNKIEEDEQDLDDAIETAREQLKEEEETWFAFARQARALKYLLELSSIIDRQALGFTIDELIIAEDEIILKAQVKGYEELKLLERELRKSKLFSVVEPQDDPDFTMRITLAKEREGE